MLRCPAAISMPPLYNRYPVRVDTKDLEMRCYALMRNAGLSVRDVADHLNVTSDVVHNMLRGGTPMSINFLTSFCATVGCSINDVLPFSNEVLRYPYKYVVPGGGAADNIAPDPYRIVLPNPDILSEDWKEAKQK